MCSKQFNRSVFYKIWGFVLAQPALLIIALASVPVKSESIQNDLGRLLKEIVSTDSQARSEVLAVLPCAVGQGVEAETGQLISEILVEQAKAQGKYTVVDRASFARVLEELEFSQTDLVDNEKQLEMGKLLVASRILTGTVSQSLGERLVVLKLVETLTGRVLGSGSITLKPSIINSAVKELLGERGQVSAALYRSAVAPGWGQFYTGHPIRGSLSTFAFLGALGTTLFFSWQSNEALTEWQNLKNKTELGFKEDECGRLSSDLACLNRAESLYNSKKNQSRSDYEEAFDRTLGFGLVTVGVYLLNLSDAALSGIQAKKKFQLYFSTMPLYSNLTVKMAFSF